MKRLTVPLLVAIAALWGVIFFAYSPGTASAEIDGDCSATFNGVNVGPLAVSSDDAIVVQEDDVVVVAFQSSQQFGEYEVNVSFLDFGSGVGAVSDVADDSQWVGNVNVSDWSNYGAGFYKVEGSSTLADGSTCTGAVLIEVDKNPLTTLAGLIAAGVTIIGLVSLLAVNLTAVLEMLRALRQAGQVVDAADYTVWRNALKPITNWVPFLMLPMLLLTGGAMATGEGAGPGGSGRQIPRASWRPRLSIVGTAGGLLFGLGLIVLLQQYAVIFPGLGELIGALVIGVVIGLVPPSIVRVFTVMSINRTLDRAEARMSGGGSPPPAPPSEPPGEPPSGDGE